MSSKVSIAYERCALILTMAYERGCVSDIKEAIPQRMRRWDEESGVWFIGLPYLDTLLAILRAHFQDEDIYLSKDVPNLIALGDVFDQFSVGED